MLDLTGENLSVYLLRELKDVVNRNPRFRNLGGDVTVHTNSMLGWGDLRVSIDGMSSAGTRMSTDYFLCTQYGRSVLCKLEGSDGLFFDRVNEIRNAANNPSSGVYYFNVDAVNEGTRDVSLTVQKYKWTDIASIYAVGSKVYFSDAIDVSKVAPVDPTIQYELQGNMLAIYTFSPDFLQLTGATGTLTPMTDFWYLRTQEVVLTTNTILGAQDISLQLDTFESVVIEDQDGYTLMEGVDYSIIGDTIRTSEWTPANATLTATFTVRVDPSTTLAAHPENIINTGLLDPVTSITSGAAKIYDPDHNLYTLADFTIVNGVVWLTNLLRTGERYTWEARVDEGLSTVTAKKMAINTNIVPGLAIAIGDQVFVGDQCAILIAPVSSETYEVYGAKENVNFTIEVKANDRMTASEIAETIKAFLLVGGRDAMEASGISIFEVSKASATAERDSSGTAPTTTYSLEVQAAADWELYIPLVNRITQFSVTVNEDAPVTDFPGKLTAAARLSAFGNSLFLPTYS